MTPSADPSVRTCQRCEAPVVKVSTIKDLAKITGKGCALYTPNVSSWRARRAMRRLYTISVERPLRPPASSLPASEERPAQRPINSMFVGLLDVGDFEGIGRSRHNPSLWERCKAFFSRD